MMEQWLPTMVAAGALGLVWFGIRAQKKELKNDVDSVEKDVDNLKETFLKEETHTLLCENASLKVNEHLTKELVSLKDDIFSKLRDIQGAIKNNNSGG